MIEFDTETRGLQWYDPDQGMFLAQFLNTRDPLVIGHPERSGQIQEWLREPEDYRAWNTKFDLHMLRAAGYDLPHERQWHDGMVVAHLIDERSSVALKARAERLFDGGEREYEKVVKSWLEKERRSRRKASRDTGEPFRDPTYASVPKELMHPYAAQDVSLTRRIGEQYDPLIAANPELRELYELERKVLAGLFWMEDRGIPVDRPALLALEAQLEGELDAAETTARTVAAFDNFNVRSPAQVGEALTRLDADTQYMTRTSEGQLKTDEENLSAVDHPLSVAVLRYRSTHKLWAMVHRMLHGKPGDSGHAAPYLTDADRLHPNFRQLGARTGRMSCSDPNFQQIHRDDLRLRYCIRAAPGKKLVVCDLDSIELRLLGAFAGEGAMLEAIRNGEDVHERTARFAGLQGRQRSAGFESPRDQGKRLNYLLLYGGGVRAMRKWLHMSQNEARGVMQRYHAAYPEIGRLQNRIEYTLEDRGYIKSPWGRRFRLSGPADREAYKYTNYLIQGTAADVMKAAVAEAHSQGVPLVAAVHDELIAEVDESDAEEAARIIEKAMTEHPRIAGKVPLAAAAVVVDRWSDAKQPGYMPQSMID